MAIENESQAVCTELFRLLKEERERRGLSKYALSAKTGLSQQAIGYIERGMTSPAFETVWRIAKGMEVDLTKLIAIAEQVSKQKHHK